MTNELKPCPFCGGGTTQIKDGTMLWLGQRYGDPVSVSVVHWCNPVKGQPNRMLERVGRDRESAIAAWNLRAESDRLQCEIDLLTQESAMLGNLLAVIHRDGGQYSQKSGIAQSCAEAEAIVAGMHSQIEAVDAIIEQAALAEREACALACEQWRSELDNRTCQSEGWAANELAEIIRARTER